MKKFYYYNDVIFQEIIEEDEQPFSNNHHKFKHLAPSPQMVSYRPLPQLLHSPLLYERLKINYMALNEANGMFQKDNLEFRNYFKDILTHSLKSLHNNQYDTKLFKMNNANSYFCYYNVDTDILQQISPILKQLNVYVGFDQQHIGPGVAVAVTNNGSDDLFLPDILPLYKIETINGIKYITATIIINIYKCKQFFNVLAAIHHELLHIKHLCEDFNIAANSSKAYEVFANSQNDYFFAQVVKTVYYNRPIICTDSFIKKIIKYISYITDKSERNARLENINAELSHLDKEWVEQEFNVEARYIILKKYCSDKTYHLIASKSFIAAEYIFYKHYLENYVNNVSNELQQELLNNINYINPKWKKWSRIFKYDKNKSEFDNLIRYYIQMLGDVISKAAKLV